MSIDFTTENSYIFNEMSKTIKDCNEFLTRFPTTESYTLKIYDDWISWDNLIKKILITYSNDKDFRECRSFLECPLKIRIKFYPSIPKLISHIIYSEKKNHNKQMIFEVSEEIQKLIK
jgi:hypothetical protein